MRVSASVMLVTLLSIGALDRARPTTRRAPAPTSPTAGGPPPNGQNDQWYKKVSRGPVVDDGGCRTIPSPPSRSAAVTGQTGAVAAASFTEVEAPGNGGEQRLVR